MKCIGSALGLGGMLIWCADQKWRFRIYVSEHTFTDYDMKISDMAITIEDPDATFYKNEETGEMWIDHSQETLGLK